MNQDRKVGRPSINKEVTRSAEKGTKPGEMRKTFLVSIDLVEKIEAIAYWDRLTVKEVVNQALADKIAKYERKSGPLKPKGKK